jgi:ferritin-like metal-binding protein YciE
MKITNRKPHALWVGAVVALAATGAFAVDNQLAQALQHAETAAKTADVKEIESHAEAAKKNINTLEQHLKSALDCLNSAIEHSTHGHVDLAKKSAEDAIVHLKAVK